MAAHYTFADHSGVQIFKTFNNPYDGLLEQCEDNPAELQAVYSRHRTNRNASQKTKLLAPHFEGVTPDEILSKLENANDHPGYVDPRHCLVFWARPTANVRALIVTIQQKLQSDLPNLWLMPDNGLHMTALEVTHSLTAPEIDALVEVLLPHVPEIANYSNTHRARLVKPMLSFDSQAFALSFLPAAGEPGNVVAEDNYSYHHLRRDLFNKVEAAGVKVESRYIVPSAHLTVGRFITRWDLETDGVVDRKKMQKLVNVVEEINQWLEKDHENQQWVVGQERGLTFRKGTLWYGVGGQTVYQGEGFSPSR